VRTPAMITGAVWTIGTATLATSVGQTSLGDYIFSGLQTENWVLVLFGCAAAAILALVVDQLLALIETGAAKRDRRRILAGAGGLIAGTLLALAPLVHASGPADKVVLGVEDFSEQYILGQLMADRLGASGYQVSQKSGLGTAVAFQALAGNELDAYVDYSGTLWANELKQTTNPPRKVLLAQLTADLMARDRVTVLGPLGFENAYAMAMRRDRAEQLGVKSLDDLARVAPQLTIGSDLEFLRPEVQGRKAVPADLHVQGRHRRRGRRHLRLLVRRPHRRRRSGGAQRPAPGHPAL
jgi:osmoprotectant transport system permease protein